MIEDIDNTWLISDTHFGHANIERLCKRPANADALMVTEWQRLVPPDALLLHLGDVAYRAEFDEWQRIIANLPGRKALILGNHDKQKPSYYEGCDFGIIGPFMAWVEGYTVSFSHYPLEKNEPRVVPNQLHIHGHIHNSGYGWGPDTAGSPARVGHCNVSVEMTKYRPVNLGTLLRAYFS